MSHSVCFDIGGTRVKSGLIKDGRIIASDVHKVSQNKELLPLLDLIESIIKKYSSDHPEIEQLIGIGLALPCFVNSEEGKVLSNYVKYADAASIDLNQWAKLKFQVPIAIQNDAKAALLGEYHYGAGKGHSDLAMITLGTGIGSAVMVNQRLLDGKDFMAGNLMGHSIINFDGTVCNCGNIGCAESEASTWALQDHESHSLAYNGKTPLNYELLFSKALAGDQNFMRVLQRSIDAWSATVINMILAYNPEAIIFSGGIMANHDIIFDNIYQKIEHHGWITASTVTLKLAEQPTFAALLGMHKSLEQIN